MSKKKLSTKEKLKILLDEEKDYVLLKPYTTYNTKIKLKHKLCGYEYEVLPDNFVRNGNRCPKCALSKRGNYHKKDLNDFKNILDEDYECLGTEYINNSTPIKIKHLKCGHEYKVSYVNYKKGKRCPYCANIKKINFCKNRKKTNEDFIKKFNNFSDSKDYEPLEKYNGIDTKIKIKHKICNNIFEMTPNMFFRGRRCPICNNCSNGELRIRKYLDSNNINYETEVSFEGLKSKKNYYLRFDFLIYIDKENYILLEYDGKQHFQESGYFKNKLDIIKENDLLKDNFCKKFKIKLYRISYKKLNKLENILNSILRSTTREKNDNYIYRY